MGIVGKEEMEVEYQMELPSSDTYKDLHAGTTVPFLQKDHIQKFLEINEQKMDPKFQELYEQRYGYSSILRGQGLIQVLKVVSLFEKKFRRAGSSRVSDALI